MTIIELIVIVAGLATGYWIVAFFIGRNRAAPNSPNSKKNREKPPRGSDHRNQDYNPEHSTESTYDEPEMQAIRIFSCPTCGQKIRVKLPLKSRTGKCKKCSDKFRIDIDDSGNLYITNTVYSRDQANSEPSISSVQDCFAMLELPKIATSSEIKAAYRRKMKEYHPDKVASLGGKLKEIAEQETKRLNKAYAMLKDRGYV